MSWNANGRCSEPTISSTSVEEIHRPHPRSEIRDQAHPPRSPFPPSCPFARSSARPSARLPRSKTARANPASAPVSLVSLVVRLSATFSRQNPGERSIFTLTRRAAARWKSQSAAPAPTSIILARPIGSENLRYPSRFQPLAMNHFRLGANDSCDLITRLVRILRFFSRQGKARANLPDRFTSDKILLNESGISLPLPFFRSPPVLLPLLTSTWIIREKLCPGRGRIPVDLMGLLFFVFWSCHVSPIDPAII